MTDNQKLSENPYPKSWFEMYSEERQKREALDQKLEERLEINNNQGIRIIELINERDTLAETLKAIDEARRTNLERAITAEAERDSLNTLVDTQKKCYDIAIKKLESAERIADDVGKTCDYWQKCAKEAEAEVKRLEAIVGNDK